MPPAPFNAFLSYHSGDSQWVATLKSALEAKGIRVWIDSEQLRPGDLFPGALASAITSIECVVVVLSRGSLASAWVEEEYSLALAHHRRVVTVLFDDVDPPGFLAGRAWVDFRDPAGFAASVDSLVFGITGTRPGGAASATTPAFRDTAATPGTDEATILEHLIARRRADERRLRLTRVMSGVGGVAVGGICFFVAADAAIEIRLAVLLIGVAIPLVAGWGVTAKGLSRIGQKVEQFEVLREGLEVCRSRSHPGCMKLRQHFWDMMVRNAATAGLDPGQVSR